MRRKKRAIITDKFWYHTRLPSSDDPGGITVSKSEQLPDGCFGLQEFIFGSLSLWFVVDDHFTDDERDQAYHGYVLLKAGLV